LNAGQLINAVGFYAATLAFGPGRYDSQWLQPGTGFVGFRFNGGAGQQFGWARITMDGAPENNFTLVDYAFADPGERITAGQTTVPDSGGSLGLLAIGFAGLLAWRFRRANVAESIAE
jgi:protein with PEP-CTERM/exosortase system signal